MLEIVLLICVGIGLAAACGFRVFVPMLIMSLAAKTEFLTLSDDFIWLHSWPAVGVLSIATLIEIGAYYIPWIDNMLDTIAVPAAFIAGTVATAACTQDVDPMLRWSLATIAGGGSAGTINLGLSGLRLGSTMLTGGVANPIVSTSEWVIAFLLSALAIVVPVLAVAVAIALLIFLARFAIKFVKRIARRNDEPAIDAAGKP